MKTNLFAILILLSTVTYSQQITGFIGASALHSDGKFDDLGVSYGVSIGQIRNTDKVRFDFGIGRFNSRNEVYETESTMFLFDIGYEIHAEPMIVSPGVFISSMLSPSIRSKQSTIPQSIIEESIQLNKLSLGTSLHIYLNNDSQTIPKLFARYGLSNTNSGLGDIMTFQAGLSVSQIIN